MPGPFWQNAKANVFIEFVLSCRKEKVPFRQTLKEDPVRAFLVCASFELACELAKPTLNVEHSKAKRIHLMETVNNVHLVTANALGLYRSYRARSLFSRHDEWPELSG